MKKVIFSTLAASSMVYGVYLDQNTDASVVAEQSTVNEVVSSVNTVDFATSNNTAMVAGQYINNGKVSMINIPLAYNVTNNIGLELSVPYVKNSVTTGKEESGIGDISGGINYHFGDFSSKYGANVSTFRYKSTTGDENKGLGIIDEAYTISHSFAKDVGAEFRGHALLSYTINGGKVIGNSYTGMVGASHPCLLYRKVRTNAKFTYMHIDENDNKFNGLNSMDLWLEWNSDKLFSSIPVGLGIKIPLVNESLNNGKATDVDKQVLFYLSMGSFFK